MKNYRVIIITSATIIHDNALAHNIFDAIAAVADYYEVNTEDIIGVKADEV